MTASARLITTSTVDVQECPPGTVAADFARELAMDTTLRGLAATAERNRLSSSEFVARVMAALPGQPPLRPRPWWRRLFGVRGARS